MVIFIGQRCGSSVRFVFILILHSRFILFHHDLFIRNYKISKGKALNVLKSLVSSIRFFPAFNIQNSLHLLNTLEFSQNYHIFYTLSLTRLLLHHWYLLRSEVSGV